MKLSGIKKDMLENIQSLINTGKQQLSLGNRSKLSASALWWVERDTRPSNGTDMDTLRFIRDTLNKGIPPVVENPALLERARGLMTDALTAAEAKWDKGDGGLLPDTATGAAWTIRNESDERPFTVAQMQQLAKELGSPWTM